MISAIDVTNYKLDYTVIFFDATAKVAGYFAK